MNPMRALLIVITVLIYLPCTAQQQPSYQNNVNKVNDLVNGNKTVNNYYNNALINSALDLDFIIKPSNFSSKPDVLLSIKNNGPIDVEDLKIFFTRYYFDRKSIDKYEHFALRKEYVKSYSTMGQVDDSAINKGLLRKHKTIKIKVNKYVSMCDNFPPTVSDSNYYFMFYVLRITFRNSLTKEKFVKYILCSALTHMPLIYEDQEMESKAKVSIGAPIDSSGADIITDFRRYIYNRQAALFGDNSSQLYHN